MSGQAAKRGDLQEWRRFMQAEGHVLLERPWLLFQQAANWPDESAPARVALTRERAGRGPRSWVRRVGKRGRGGALLVTLSGHAGDVLACAYSPDGRRIVSGTTRGTCEVRVWEAETGRLLSAFPCEENENVGGLAFSRDGRRLLVTLGDGYHDYHGCDTVRLLDAETGDALASFGCGEGNWKAYSFALSPDGRLVAAGSYGPPASVKLFESSSGRLAAELAVEDQSLFKSVRACSFSPDGRLLAAGTGSGRVAVWDATTRAEVFAADASFGDDRCDWTAFYREWDKPKPANTLAIAFTPDGSRLVAVGSNLTVKAWDAATWAEVLCAPADESMELAALSPDTGRVAAAANARLVIWDYAAGGKPAAVGQHVHTVRCCAFSPDGARVVTCEGDSALRVWDARGSDNGASEGHTAHINACRFSPDGRHIVTASADKTAKVWDAATGRVTATLGGYAKEVKSLLYSPDGARLLALSEEGLILWDYRTGAELARPGFNTHENHQDLYAFMPDGLRVVSCLGGKILFWSVQTGRLMLSRDARAEYISGFAVLAGGARLLTRALDNAVRLWDAETGALVATLTEARGGFVSWAASPDGARLVTERDFQTLKICDALTGEELHALAHADTIRDCRFSADGSLIVSDTYGQFKLWDAATGRELSALDARGLDSHWALSPDGRRLLASSYDRVRLLDMRTGEGFDLGVGGSYAHGFSPDSAVAYACGDDALLRLWDAATAQEMACYPLGGAYPATDWSPDNSTLAVADAAGELHLLRFERTRA